MRRCIVLGLALGLIGCRRAPAPAPVAQHVVIVTIDTLRADRLGCYGAREVVTPRLDGIAAEGARAIEASAHVPLTRPSHVSLFTGLLPTEHGIRDNVSPAVVPQVPLLAERFRENGFATAAFVSSIVLESQSGLDRGFDVYSDRFEGSGGDAQFLSTVQRKGEDTVAEAVAWLGGQRGRRVFLWLHLYEPHDPYEPPEPYASRYAGRPYDGEVAWTDELFGRFEDALGSLGMREATALLVTSDHGEGLGEHDESLHGFFAYQSTLRVPFLVRGPGIVAGRRLERPVRLVDVFPTALELAGLAPASVASSGRSLAPTLRGGPEPEEAAVYAETLVPLLHFGWSDLRVIREGRFKYIQAPRPELYDLRDDPGEGHDLASARPTQAQAMRAALATVLDGERRQRETSTAPGPSQELIERLGALGYVGGSGAAETATPGADPKDRIEEFRVVNSLIREALVAFHAKDPAGSASKLRQVLARGISSFEVHYYLARALLAQGQAAEAGRHFDEAASRVPTHAAAWEGAADCRIRLGDREGALSRLRRGVEALPRDARLSAKLGELLRDTGNVEEATRRLRAAVELDPSVASYWNVLGMTLGGRGQLVEAEKAFREAWRLDGRNHHHAYNLGLILLRQGRAVEARAYFEQALAIDARFAPARARLAEMGKRAG